MIEVDAPARRRTELIDGLRELADFIECTPDAPIPLMPVLRLQVDRDEYDNAVAVIGAATTDTTGGFDVAERRFGSIAYGVQRYQKCTQ